MELELKDIVKELNSQKDHNAIVCKEVERLERSLKHNEVIKMRAVILTFFLSELYKFDFDLQLLEKEKVHLESEMKDVLKELELQRKQNNLMHDEIKRLELGQEQNKVFAFRNNNSFTYF